MGRGSLQAPQNEVVTSASAPSVASAGARLVCSSKHDLIGSSPIAVSTDETDAADAIFGTCAHPDHPAPGAPFTRERDFNSDVAAEGLRPSKSAGERPRVFCPSGKLKRLPADLNLGIPKGP